MPLKQYEIRYLPLFYEDLEQKILYIAETLKNPDAAEALLEAVEKAIQERSFCAESFAHYPSIKKRPYPYYAIYIRNYIVFYVVIDHRIMEIRRFLYKGQNKGRLLP